MTTVTELMPRAHFDMPSADEARRLRDIVVQEYREFRETPESEFPRAFWVAGTFYRVPQPVSSVYYSHWLEIANQRLERAGLAPIGGGSLLVGCLSHGDVHWQAATIGRSASCLSSRSNEFHGRSCNNVWRDILAGERGLLKPTPPDRGIVPQPLTVIRSASEW